ncbi:MAG: glutaredoxin family protein [Bacillota bacterium]|nr:glutaredoxin family protein [Bacillota bacterium]
MSSSSQEPVRLVLYTLGPCLASTQLREYLQLKKLAYEERNIQERPAWGRELRQRLGYVTAPVLLVGEEAVFGFDVPRLERLLLPRPRLD